MKKVLTALSLAILLVSCSSEKVFTVSPDNGDCTAAIQKKLDRCFLSGGGRVVLKKGEYHVGGLRVRSNTTLYLKSGARLVGSRDCRDYRIMAGDTLEALDPEDVCTDSVVWLRPRERKDGKAWHITIAGSRWNDAIIRIYKAQNVSIIGEKGAVIDGCNSFDPEGEEHYRGVHGISAHKSRDIVFKGYTICNTGNWAHLMRNCTNVLYEDLEILGGHDGVHISTCDSVSILDCVMKTGDDCVAGFDNRYVTVRGCTFNTACSAFRYGGTHLLAEDCRCYGPGEYPIRGSLSKEEKEAGAMGEGGGRRNMLALFTYYADKTLEIREKPGDIVLRNIECENMDRFLHYNFSGNETWQLGMPLDGITFENVHASGIKLPLCAYSTPECPFSLTLKGCSIAFEAPVPECIRGAYIREVVADGLSVEGASDAPLVRSWAGDDPELIIEGLSGAAAEVAPADRPFKVKSI